MSLPCLPYSPPPPPPPLSLRQAAVVTLSRWIQTPKCLQKIATKGCSLQFNALRYFISLCEKLQFMQLCQITKSLQKAGLSKDATLSQDGQTIMLHLFIYLGFYVAFNTVQVISQRVVGRAEETSIYSSLGFCTVNCRPTASNYQLSHLRPCQESNPGLRGGRPDYVTVLRVYTQNQCSGHINKWRHYCSEWPISPFLSCNNK